MTLLLGIDFTSAPSRRKPITVARARLKGAVLKIEAVDAIDGFGGFEALLHSPGPWLAACDFPFGLPRAFVDDHRLGSSAAAVIAEVQRRCPTRMAWRAFIDAWGNAQPKGQRLLHRRTDTAVPGASSTSPLQTRYVPVGFMYYEGLARLVAAGVHLPGLHAGDVQRVAVEAYPGLLAHELIGTRSYKNDASEERFIARKEIVDRLEQGRTRLALRLRIGAGQRDAVLADAGGDRLDALLCAMQAAWCSQRPEAGRPAGADPIEGWIATT
jgi:hypothetical protein